jgi:preprotein translocase subunit SecA
MYNDLDEVQILETHGQELRDRQLQDAIVSSSQIKGYYFVLAEDDHSVSTFDGRALWGLTNYTDTTAQIDTARKSQQRVSVKWITDEVLRHAIAQQCAISLFIVCQLGKKDNKEYWISIAAKTIPGHGIDVYITGRFDFGNQVLSEKYNGLKCYISSVFQDIKIEFHETIKNESDECNIDVAYRAINNFSIFNDIKISYRHNRGSMSHNGRVIYIAGLAFRCWKLKVKDFDSVDSSYQQSLMFALLMLDKLIKDDNTYIPDIDLLYDLTDMVGSAHSDSHAWGYDKLRTEVLQLIYYLQNESRIPERRSSSSRGKEDILNNLNRYFSSIKKHTEKDNGKVHYTVSDLEKNIQELEKDSRKGIQDLKNAIKHRMDFLQYQACLSLDKLDVKDLDEFFKLMGGYSRIAGLKEQKQRLDNKLDKLGRPNAYNQAYTDYWYSSEDIAAIGTELLKDYSRDFKLTQAIDKNKLLSVIEEYKKDLKPTFIPLNIRGNHWVAVALMPDQGEPDKHIVLYKDSLGDIKYFIEREEIKKIFKQQLQILDNDFIFHAGKEQVDEYNCGVFALANLEVMAKLIRSNPSNSNSFFQSIFSNSRIISNPEHCFIDSIKAESLRHSEYPTLYALSLCAGDKRRVICDHHQEELTNIQLQLEARGYLVSIDGIKPTKSKQIRLSIALPQEELLTSDDYQYLYKIETASNENLGDINQILGIEIQAYSSEQNIFKIPYQQLEYKVQAQPKLLREQRLISLSDSRIEELLIDLGININQHNKSILRSKLQFSLTDEAEPASEETSVTTQIDINSQQIRLQHEIDYLTAISDIRAQLSFDEFIIVLGQKIDAIRDNTLRNKEETKEQDINNVVHISHETINLILDVSLKTKNTKVILAVISILTASTENKLLPEVRLKLNEWFKNALQQISNDEDTVNRIIDFARVLLPDFLVESVINYINQLLIDNESDLIRQRAFDLLLSNNSLLYSNMAIQATIGLENCCKKYNDSQDIDKLLIELKDHVEAKRPLTFNCFDILSNYFNNSGTKEIIITIIKNDIQKLPRCFIDRFISYIKTLPLQDASVTETEEESVNIIAMSNSFIEGDYIGLSDIAETITLLLDQTRNNDDVLELIFTTIECGKQIPDTVIAKIEYLSRESSSINKTQLENVLRLIRRNTPNYTSDEVDILMNPRGEREVRQKALDGILEKLISGTLGSSENEKIYLSKLLISLITYDTDLRFKALEVLARILPENYIEKGYPDLSEILVYLVSNTEVHTKDQERVLNSLIDISKRDKFTEEQVMALFRIAINSTNYSLQKKVFDIIRSNVTSRTIEFVMTIDSNGRLIPIYNTAEMDKIGKSIIIEQIINHHQPELEVIKEKLSNIGFALSGEEEKQNSERSVPLKLAITIPVETIIDNSYQYFYVIENPNISLINDIESWSDVISALSVVDKTGMICEGNSLKIPYRVLTEIHHQPLKDISQKPREIIKLGDELQRLEDIDRLGDINKENIQQIERIISSRYYILADDKIDLLLQELSRNSEDDIGDQIATILLQIDDNQNLKSTHWDNICEAVRANESLIQIPNIIVLITRGLYGCNIKINSYPLITNKLQQIYLGNSINDENLLTHAILALSLQGQEITGDVLQKLASTLENNQLDISLRIRIAKAISSAIKHSPNYETAVLAEIIDKLKNVAIEDDTNPVLVSDNGFYDHNVLTRVAFLSLEQEAQAGRLDQEFFTNYWNKLKQKLTLSKTESATDVLHQVNTATLEPLTKYYLLRAITNTIVNNYELDTTIFTDFHANEWGKELLASELLKIALDNSNLVSGVSEFVLLKFRNNITRLSYLVDNPSDSNIKVENLLQKLIDNCYQFNLEIVNNITDMLIGLKPDSDNALKILQSNSGNFYIDLRALWLKQHLESIGIESAIQVQKEETSELGCQGQDQLAKDKELKVLNTHLLPYTTELIIHTFSKIKDKAITSIVDLIDFFNKLNNSNIPLEGKKQFLASSISGNSSIHSWINKLFSEQVKVYICKKFSISEESRLESDTILGKLHKKLTMVMESGWSLSSVQRLVQNIDNQQKFEALVNALDPIYEYTIKEYDSNIRGQNIFTILNDCEIHQWESKIHELAIYNTFTGSYDIPREKLIDKIKETAPNVGILGDNKLLQQYNQVDIAYEGRSSLAIPPSQSEIGQSSKAEVEVLEKYLQEKAIKDWNKEEIKLWANKIRANPELANRVELHEKIAVVKRAVEINSGFPPRDVQLLSLLIMLNPEENKGRLAQINTGEGKTTIVAMLAAIKALEGHKVDIITSSSELAKPQSRQQEKFFNTLGLTVSHNGEDSKAKETRYLSDIVYGAAGDFQGDILRDEYSKLGTRSGRKCDVAIVDEVDSMLIDGRHHIVMLSTPLPAMDHLEPILAAIWIQLREVAKCIKESNGKAYFIESPEALDENGKLKTDLIESLYPIEGKKEDFIKKATLKHIKKLLRDESLIITNHDDPNYDEEWNDYIGKEKSNEIEQGKRFPEIKIPQHLRDLVLQCQLSEWIDSAIYAKYRCEINKHYVLDKGKIAPVDASNTGVVQQNMHWNNGLHQFLQIKHGAKITAESLTTNFISNVTYFKRYGSNIYGLTGTLGSDRARKLLNNTYGVDSIIIPPFRKKQYKELTPVITNTEAGWYNNIIETSLSKLRNGRGVLVITEYIKIAEEIARRLKEDYHYDTSKIKLYKTSEDSHVIEEELKPGEIIIATNIAGRGTDIKPNSQVEKNGGLHVCSTSLADTQRVEEQNVGRTSRTGNKGTSQFILLRTDGDDLTILKKERNTAENLSLDNAKKEIQKVLRQDEVFKEFCQLLEEFRNLDRNDPIIKAVEERFGIWLKMQEQENIPIEQRVKLCEEVLLDWYENEKKKEDRTAITLIETSFGIDLSTLENGLINLIQTSYCDDYHTDQDSAESFLQDISRGLSNNTVYDNPLEVYKTKKLLLKFKKFKGEILDERSKKDSLIKNPCYYVLRGNDLLSNKQNKEAIAEFKKAVELDPYFQVHAYYNMGYARIAEYGNARKEDYDREIPKAVEDLRKARKIIEDNLEPMLNLIQQASTSKALSEQVQHKMALYAAQKSAIEQAVGIGSDGMRTKRIAEDHQLNIRINKRKIDQKFSELRLAEHTAEKIKDEITEFEMALPEVTEEERKKLRTKDIKDAIRAQKITVEETKINKELTETKETVKKYEALSEVEKLNYKLPVLPLGGILSIGVKSYGQYAYSVKTEAEAKKEAFNNFKNGATVTAEQQRFYEEFERNVNPTSKEISDKRAEMTKQDNLLENGIIGQALKNKNGVKIELVDIKKSLPEDQDVSLYNDEISEFRGNGFYGTFQVTEIKPIPWWSVIGMGLLALGQMIGGAALTVFTLGAGSSIGMGLITEGVSDLITAVKDGIINRSLDWASWAIQKAISLTVSIVCAGLGAIKDAAKTAVAGIKAAAGAVKTAALGGKVIIEQTVKNGWKLAAKAVGVSIAKGVAKEVVTQLVDYGISKALMPSIEEEVRKRVEGPIQEALTNEMTSLGQIVKKMLELDGKNRNNYYQSLIKRKAMEILNPQNNPEHALLTITKGIAKGIASNKIPGLSTVLQIGEAVAALDELSTFVPTFIDNLTQEMTNIAQQEEIDKKYSELIQSNQTHTKHTTATSDATDSKTGIEERKEDKKSLVSDRQHVSAPTIPSTLGDVDLNKGEEEQTQVELSDIVKSPEELRTTISGSISANMCSVIQGKLICPLAHAGVNFGMQKLTAGIDQNLQNELGNYQAERRLQFMGSHDKGNRVPEEHKKGWQNEEAMQQAMEKANEMIEDLKSEGEAGLPHLGALSDKTKRPIAVYDEKGKLQYVIGGDKGGEPIKVEHRKNQDGSGHWTLPGGVEAPVSGTNNCLFDVIAAQTGENGKALRDATVAHMHSNLDSLAHQAADITRLETYKKDALRMGGKLILVNQDERIQFEQHLKNLHPGVKYNEETNEFEIDKEISIPENRTQGAKLVQALIDNPKSVKLKQGLGSEFRFKNGKPTVIFDTTQTGFRLVIRDGQLFKSQFSKHPELVLGHELIHANRYLHRLNSAMEPLDKERRYKLNFPTELDPYLKAGYDSESVHQFRAPREELQTIGILRTSKRELSRKPKYAHVTENDLRQERGLGKALAYVLPGRFDEPGRFDDEHQGLGHSNLATMDGIHTSFYEYTMQRISNILRLRTSTNKLNSVTIFPGIYMFSAKYNNITTLFYDVRRSAGNVSYMNKSNPIVFLAPLSLHGKHAVGVMFVAQGDGSGYKAFYLDPENTTIPENLAAIFKDNGYEIEQLPTEGQRYTNCGPEVIENFMLYLTGERLSQEEAIVNNSRLVEQELLSYGGAKEEANCLTLKDNYNKQDTVTVISNVAYDTQVSSDGYIIGNPTRYDIVTPQSIIDEVVVRAELGRESRDVLLELVHDYRINQDHDEVILGEVTSIDIYASI